MRMGTTRIPGMRRVLSVLQKASTSFHHLLVLQLNCTECQGRRSHPSHMEIPKAKHSTKIETLSLNFHVRAIDPRKEALRN